MRCGGIRPLKQGNEVNKLTLFALLQVIFTVCILWIVYEQSRTADGALPYRFELTEREGVVSSVVADSGKGRHDILFSLYGDPDRYIYNTKSGASDRVYRALQDAAGKNVYLLCDMISGYGQAYSPFSRRCFEVRVGDQLIRSYGEVQEARVSDATLGQYFVVIMVILSVVMLFLAYRHVRWLKRSF